MAKAKSGKVKVGSIWYQGPSFGWPHSYILKVISGPSDVAGWCQVKTSTGMEGMIQASELSGLWQPYRASKLAELYLFPEGAEPHG